MPDNSQLELGLPRYRCFLDMDGVLALLEQVAVDDTQG